MASHAEMSFIGRSNANQQQYFFPKLPTSEILKCLSELGITISKEELLHPDQHKEAIKRLFEYLVEICLGVGREELGQPAFAGLQSINYPELHEESIPHLNGLRAIMKMMEICEVPDFSLRDIVTPNVSRLNRQLSGIINFAKFREEKLMLLSDLSTTREELLDGLSKGQEKNENLNNRLSLLREQTKEEADMIRSLESECKAFEHNISELQRVQALLDAESNELSSKNHHLQNKIQESLEQFEDLTSIQRRLTSQVVTSPEKFRKQIIEVGQTLQHEQKDAKIAEKRVKELSAWLVNVEEAQGEVGLALESIQEVRSEVERQKAIISDLDSQKQTISGLKTTLSELNQNAQQYQRQANRADEKLSHLRKQATSRAEEAQNTIEEIHKQLLEADAFRLQVTITTINICCY